MKKDQPNRIVMWHGSRAWTGTPEVRGHKAGRAERGAGIYATTHLETAQKYAKGGGAVRKLVFTPSLLLERAALSLNDTISFVQEIVPRGMREDFIERLTDAASRHNLEGRKLVGSDGPHFMADSLVALFVNSDISHGKKGVALTEFLVSQGIDGSFMRESGNEYWAVIFNPLCIESHDIARGVSLADKDAELDSPYIQMTGNKTSKHQDKGVDFSR